MPRKCKQGITCINNSTIFVLLLCALGVYMFYKKTSQQSQSTEKITFVKINDNVSSLQNRFFPMGFTNISSDVLSDPYAAPLRDPRVFPRNSSDIRGIPINIKTQGYNTSYRQVGILTRNGNSETILPLMGRPLMANRDKWQFYTINDKFNGIKLPVVSNGKSCTNEYGCNDLMNGDNVYVEGYNDSFKVTIYDTNIPEYIPFL